MQQTKQSKWNAFVSLTWYDQAIEFLFRFVAKTSEPLLALGIVISAVDFLTKGALLTNDQSLTMAWAWTQAVAIEASSGVVFVYALQSFKGKDKVKGWLYLILSVLLAITGGAMLLLQLVANLTSIGESALPGYLVIGLVVLRVVVSIGYVYMCRAKHIRFTDLEEVKRTVSPETPGETPPAISDETVQLILSKLAKLDQLEQAISQQKVTVIEESETALALPASSETLALNRPQIKMKPGFTSLHQVETVIAPENADVPTIQSDETSLEAQIVVLLAEKPALSSRKVAELLDKPHSTVYRYMSQMKQSVKQPVSGETHEEQ
jgi:hypothetical protein